MTGFQFPWSARWIVCIALSGVWLNAFVGCRPTPPVRTTYDANDRVTAYETDRVPLPSMEWGSTLGGEASVGLEAKAWCLGRACTPREVSLIFHVSGQSESLMGDRSVELNADGELVYSGPGQKQQTGEFQNQKVPAVGVIAIADVSFRQFRTLAKANQVRGTVGSAEFSVGFEDRAPFRALVREAR